MRFSKQIFTTINLPHKLLPRKIDHLARHIFSPIISYNDNFFKSLPAGGPDIITII